MPHHCIVPFCTNRSGRKNGPKYSFYRLPLNNPPLLKQWLVKIRRENTPLNKNSRVCSAHFKGGNKSARTSPGKRHFSSEGSKTLQSDSSTEETETVLQEILNQ